MGQLDKGLRILVVDSDETFRAELQSLTGIGIHIAFHETAVELTEQLAHRDVVVVAVDSPASLAVIADICTRAGSPAVIAVGAAGFEKKPLEHVLLLAELRGAMTSLPKPIEAAELAMVATRVHAAHTLKRPPSSETHATPRSASNRDRISN